MAEKKISLDLEINKGNTDKTVKSIKTELREAKEEAIALARKFGEFSPEAQKAAAKLASLKDEMGDLNQAVQGLNPDKFARLATLTNGVVRGFQAASGAAVLFGKTGEDIEKTLAKLQATMALADGIQGVLDARKSFSALANQIKGSVVKAFSTLKGAIAATGIGALVVALGLLVANFDQVKKYILNLFPGLEKLGGFVTGLINGFTDFMGITTKAGRALEDSVKSQETALEKLNGWLDRNLDKYDKFTAAKFKADQEYKAKKLELDKQLTEGLNQAEYNQTLKELQAQKQRAVLRADQDRQIAKDELNAKIQADADKIRQERKSAQEKLEADRQLRLKEQLEQIDILVKTSEKKGELGIKEAERQLALNQTLKDINNLNNQQIIEDTKKRNDGIEKLNKEHYVRSEAEEKQYQENLKNLKYSAVYATFDLLSALNQQGQDATEAAQKKAFERNKALAVAETVITTYQAAALAYKNGLQTGDVTQTTSILGAAVAVAQGLAKLVVIKKQTFNGSSSSGTASSGGGGGSVGMQAPQTGFTQIRTPNQNPTNNQPKTPPIKVVVLQKEIQDANSTADRITAKAVVK